MRLRLVPKETKIDFFGRWKLWLGISGMAMVIAFASFLLQGLNYGIDFRGGTTIRTESTQAIDIGAYRGAIAELGLGDVSITEVFDPSFGPEKNVAMVRIQAQDGQESVSAELIETVEAALGALVGGRMSFAVTGVNATTDQLAAALADLPVTPEIAAEGGTAQIAFPADTPAGERLAAHEALTRLGVDGVDVSYDSFKIISVESVGPKVSGELIQTAVIAVTLAIGAVLVYIWLRFEWQFALGAVVALIHDVLLTIGIFSELQIRFDLAIIAALLTIVGYSLNDTVIVFDRVRENLRKYKQMPLAEVLNLSINETLSRTTMTSFTTLLALISLYVLGGDVIRGFVFAMIWGVVVGTYSSIFVASTILLWLGVKRDWSKPDANAGTQFANVDA